MKHSKQHYLPAVRNTFYKSPGAENSAFGTVRYVCVFLRAPVRAPVRLHVGGVSGQVYIRGHL